LFDDYQHLNNNNLPITVASAQLKRKHGKDFEPGNRKPITFYERHWLGDLGVARYQLTGGKSGWMLFHGQKGLIDEAHWTYTPPPKRLNQGVTAQGADVATTAVALSQGLSELNPIVGSAMIPAAAIKLAGLPLAKRYASFEACRGLQDVGTDIGWAAAAANVVAIAGGGMAAIPVGVATFVISARKRDGFWECLPRELVSKF
jgi:hypothetical protein